MRGMLVAVLAVALCAVALAQTSSPSPFVTATVNPTCVDAGYLTSLLWGQEPGEKQMRNFFPHFAANLVYQSVAELPDARCEAVQGSCAWSYTQDRVISAASADSLLKRPELMVCQNAILLNGRPDAVAQAEASIRAQDVPRSGVSFDVIMVDLPAKDVDKWALNWSSMPDLAAAESLVTPPRAAAGIRYFAASEYGVHRVPVLRYAIDDGAIFGPAVAGQQGIVEGAFVVDRAQGIIALGESVPVSPIYSCCEFMHSGCTPGYCTICHSRGKRLPWAIFEGVELWLRPRIQADGTISMLFRPRLTEWAGLVDTLSPDPVVPITRYQSAITPLSIVPGQSIIISGLTRDHYLLNHELMGSARLCASRMLHNPVIIITPRIVVPASV